MKEGISSSLLSKLSQFVTAHIGLEFPEEQWADLERRTNCAARELNFDDVPSFVECLHSSPHSPKYIEVLGSYLTVGETYFMREEKALEILKGTILPELIAARKVSARRLKIWSAGCSTGEEAYTIAMILQQIVPDIADWNVTILASDINVKALQKASAGIYTKWSFRRTPSFIQAKYFRPLSKGRFEVIPEIKKMVNFFYLNLADQNYPSQGNNTGNIDIIFCRNVLMYFTPQWRQRIIRNFYKSLNEKGWLIVSPSESFNLHSTNFRTVNFPGAILYQKDKAYHRKTVTHQSAIPELTPLLVENSAPEVPPVAEVFSIPQAEINSTIKPAIMDPAEEVSGNPEQTRYSKALQYYNEGYYNRTIDVLSELFHNNPSETERNDEDDHALTLMARAYANLGDLATAQRWCEKAITVNKLNPSNYFLLATVLQEQHKPEQAITALKRSLYLEPDFIMAHFALGNIYRMQNKMAESRRHYANAAALVNSVQPEEELPESGGLTAGRLKEIIQSVTLQENVYER